MSKIFFNEHQRRQLELNPNVASISDRAIQYKSESKILVVQENLKGKDLRKSLSKIVDEYIEHYNSTRKQ